MTSATSPSPSTFVTVPTLTPAMRTGDGRPERRRVPERRLDLVAVADEREVLRVGEVEPSESSQDEAREAARGREVLAPDARSTLVRAGTPSNVVGCSCPGCRARCRSLLAPSSYARCPPRTPAPGRAQRCSGTGWCAGSCRGRFRPRSPARSRGCPRCSGPIGLFDASLCPDAMPGADVPGLVPWLNRLGRLSKRIAP